MPITEEKTRLKHQRAVFDCLELVAQSSSNEKNKLT